MIVRINSVAPKGALLGYELAAATNPEGSGGAAMLLRIDFCNGIAVTPEPSGFVERR